MPKGIFKIIKVMSAQKCLWYSSQQRWTWNNEGQWWKMAARRRPARKKERQDSYKTMSNTKKTVYYHSDSESSLDRFNDISTIVGYLMPNPFLYI